MRKREELNNAQSCLNKAGMDELVFVLLERDPAAPIAITAWIEARVRLGKNRPGDDQLREAEEVVAVMLSSKTKDMRGVVLEPVMLGLPDEYPPPADDPMRKLLERAQTAMANAARHLPPRDTQTSEFGEVQLLIDRELTK